MALQHIAANQYGDVARARVVNTKEIAEEYHIPVELLGKGSYKPWPRADSSIATTDPKAAICSARTLARSRLPRCWKAWRAPRHHGLLTRERRRCLHAT